MVGRNKNGTFEKGHPNFGAGRKPVAEEESLRETWRKKCTPERFGNIIDIVYKKAEHGDMAAIRILFEWGLSKPPVEIRADVEHEVLIWDLPNRSAE